MKKWLLWGGVLGALVALWGLYQWTRPLPEVALHSLETGRVESTVANTRAGTIKACRRSRLSMPLGGVVDKLYVDEGDHVAAGDVLLELWNRDRRALLAEAEGSAEAAKLAETEACITADQARRDATRLEQLAARGMASTDAVENAETKAQAAALACRAAKAKAKVAVAARELAEANLALTILQAPFAGVVAEINGEVGEYVTPSPPGVPTPPAVDLLDDSCLYVSAPIDEVDAMPVQVGMPARITLDAFRDRVFAGTLTRIAPYVLEQEKQARTVDVDVQFDGIPEDVPLLVGYSADIEVILDARDNVLRVPTEAILEGDRVLRFNPDSATLEQVSFEPGLSNWTYTEVRSGLSAGDRIVVRLDQAGASAGNKVQPAP